MIKILLLLTILLNSIVTFASSSSDFCQVQSSKCSCQQSQSSSSSSPFQYSCNPFLTKILLGGNNNNQPPPNCSNLGFLLPNSDPAVCMCPLTQWQGPECLTRTCANDNTLPGAAPDSQTNVCQCRDPAHNEGISCQLCKNGGGCNTAAGEFCDENILSIGPDSLETNAECDVADDSFNALLNGQGVATYNCKLPNQTSGQKDGSCAVSFFRKSAPDPKLTTYDNYFHCNLKKCSATQQNILLGKKSSVSSPTKHLFAFARIVMLLLLLCFVGFRWVTSIPTRAYLVAVFSTLAIVLILLLMLTIWVVSSHSTTDNTESVVVYDCDASACSCYSDVGHSANRGDACIGSIFGDKFLPVLTSGAILKCGLGGGFSERSCTFLQKDLNSEVALKCKGSVCRSKNQNSNSPNNNNNALNISTGNSSATTTTTNPADSFTFFDAVKQKLTSGVLLILAAIFGISFLFLYIKRTQTEMKNAADEFKVRFLTVVTTTPNNNNNNELRNNQRQQQQQQKQQSSSNANANAAKGGNGRVGEEEKPKPKSNNNNNNNNNNKTMDDIFLPPSEAEVTTRSTSDDDTIPRTPPTTDPFPTNSNNNNNTTQQQLFPNTINNNNHVTARTHPSQTSLPELFSISTMNLSYTVQNTTSSANTSNNNNNTSSNNSNIAVLTQTQVLRNVTINLPGGHLVAIMGASGSSKTTLLDAISGTLNIQGDMSGSVVADHRVIFPNPNHDSAISTEFESYCAVSSYVAQNDILLPSLTVREAILFSARLKLPAVLESVQIAEITNIVIELLHLEECADRLIGGGTSDIRGLSGGERRRVSVAIELVGCPRYLLCDEICSGLDSANALHVVECLSDIVQGKSKLFNHPALGGYAHYRPLVVFSVHQPSEAMYRLFDSVVLMHKGRAVFCGASVSALPFLLENVRSEIMASSIDLTVPERLLSISDYGDHELNKAAAATNSAMMSSIAASSSSQQQQSSGNLSLFSPVVGSRGGSNWLLDEEGNSNNHNHDNNITTQSAVVATSRNSISAANNNNNNNNDEISPISRIQFAAANRHRYAQRWSSQVGYLVLRGWRSNITTYNIMFSHAFATLFIGSMLALLYHAEPLTLPGALDRAGAMTYLLLVTAFLSLSSIDWIVTERRLLHFERRNQCYGTAQYFLSKFFVDFLPYRIVPSALLSILVYEPMGLRTDKGSFFAWFALVQCLFAVQTSAMTMCAAALTSTFGAAALLSAIIILWNFVFCGLLIQAGTLPAFFVLFRDISPFFLGFEALLVNELDGQNCQFAPVDASGRPSSHQIPLYCRQYLYNLGLHPENFSKDIIMLTMWCGVFLFLAGLCLHGVPEWIQVFWAKMKKNILTKCGCCCCCCKKPTQVEFISENENIINNNYVEHQSLVRTGRNADNDDEE